MIVKKISTLVQE